MQQNTCEGENFCQGTRFLGWACLSTLSVVDRHLRLRCQSTSASAQVTVDLAVNRLGSEGWLSLLELPSSTNSLSTVTPDLKCDRHHNLPNRDVLQQDELYLLNPLLFGMYKLLAVDIIVIYLSESGML